MVATKKKTYTKKIVLSPKMKPIKFTLTGKPTLYYKEKGLKGFLGTRKRVLTLPKGSNANEIFYRPYNRTVYIKYTK